MKTYKAESFDKMQYLYGAAHDPLVHGVIRFSGRIDIAALNKAVTASLCAVPMLRCCFEMRAGSPRWVDRNFTGEDIVSVIDAETFDEAQIQRLLATTIDIFHEPQLKLLVMRTGAFDSLCVIMNHMVCDGAGLKEYLGLLAGLYTKCVRGEKMLPPVCGPRGTAQLFKRFGFFEKLKILFMNYDVSALKAQRPYRLEGDPDTPFFLSFKTRREELLQLKDAAKKQGVTINDMVLCAYIRVLHRRVGGGRVVMPCPVDLRKYLQSAQSPGICNLTSNYICDIAIREGDTAEQTLEQVAQQMRQQKDSVGCLKSMISMEMAFGAIPFFIMKSLFLKVFMIPVVSFTNLGVIDKASLSFGDTDITDAYLTGAVKRVPYFQISISTFDGCCTFCCNMFGTQGDRTAVTSFLAELREELLSYTG